MATREDILSSILVELGRFTHSAADGLRTRPTPGGCAPGWNLEEDDDGYWLVHESGLLPEGEGAPWPSRDDAEARTWMHHQHWTPGGAK